MGKMMTFRVPASTWIWRGPPDCPSPSASPPNSQSKNEKNLEIFNAKNRNKFPIRNLERTITWRFLKQKTETSSKFLNLEAETMISKCPNRKETGVLNSLPTRRNKPKEM